MLNRRTALIFTDADRANAASAVKQQLSALMPGGAVIIIDDAELYADAFKDFLEKVFGIPANIEKRLADRRERKIRSLVSVTPQSANTFKPADAYRRMENILNRYTPELVVSIGFGAFNEAVAVRDKQGANFKVVAYIDDFALNRQLINTYMDGYVVYDMAIKTTLVNAKVDEDSVKLAAIAVGKGFLEAPSKAEALNNLKISAAKPVVTMVCTGKGDYSEYFSAASRFADEITFLAYCGENRLSYRQAIKYGLYAYNEGASLPELYSAAEAVMTPPESYYAAAAATTGKILALTAPRDNLEKMNADKLKAYSENASDEYAAENFFRHLLAGKSKPVPLPMPANGVGEALLSFADE